MGLRKKTIQLVNKILHDKNKRKMYSDEEISYMQRQVKLLEIERKRRKLQRKIEKGFGETEEFDYPGQKERSE